MLHMPTEQRGQLSAWAVETYPYEGCGLLLGRRDGEAAHVRRVRRACNLNSKRARDRYDLDPRDYLAAEKEAAEAGLEVIGIWHTHPDHSAHPSAVDEEAAWAGWSYVILAVTSAGVHELRSWRFAAGRGFTEEAVWP